MGWPAVVQVPDEPVDAVPEAEAGAALELDELSAGAKAEAAAAGAAAATGATEGEAATGAAAATGATDGEAAAGAAAGAAAAATPEVPDAPHFGPVGGAKTSALFALAFSTETPALGNLTSAPSAVVQSLTGILAMNISGKFEADPRSESS